MAELPLQDILNNRFKLRDPWENSLAILNELGWNLSWRNHKNLWILLSGDQPIFVSDTKQELDAFIYGMATSVADFPEELYLQVKQEFGLN